MQTVVMASTLRRSIDSVATLNSGVNVDERSILSAVLVFMEKLKKDNQFTEVEEEIMAMVAAAAKQVEAKIGGKPDVIVYLCTHPKTCLRRISKRYQPDDASISLKELENLDELHREMMRQATQEGVTVVFVDEVQQFQRKKQMCELASYLESIASGEEDEGKPVYLTIRKPKVTEIIICT